jgi:phage/plasmid-associated DNA primase
MLLEQHLPRRVLDARLADPAELSGVLNKALSVLPSLRSRGFTESQSMKQAAMEFRQTTDPLAVWLDHATIQGPEVFVAKDVLYSFFMMTGHSLSVSQRGDRRSRSTSGRR